MTTERRNRRVIYPEQVIRVKDNTNYREAKYRQKTTQNQTKRMEIISEKECPQSIMLLECVYMIFILTYN